MEEVAWAIKAAVTTITAKAPSAQMTAPTLHSVDGSLSWTVSYLTAAQ